MMIFSLVAMIGLDKCCITSACLQWLCHSGERIVARGPLVWVYHIVARFITNKGTSTECCGTRTKYEGVSINNQPIPFPMDRDGHDFHALFRYMFYTWVQNCTRIESFFNKILNVKYG